MTDTAPQADYKKVLMKLLSSQPVAYWPALARVVGGVQEAVMLSQLLYRTNSKAAQDRSGWFWKSAAEMYAETGLTTYQQQNARRSLIALGLIECKLIGVPRTWWYRVDMDRLAQTIVQGTHSMDNSFNGELIEWETHSMSSPPNIVRGTKGTFTKELGQHSTRNSDNLIKNQLTHQRPHKNHADTTSSSDAQSAAGAAPQGNEEEGLSAVVIEALERVGVFEDLYPKVRAIQIKRGLDDQQLIDLADRLLKKFEPERAASLYLYRLKNLKSRNSALYGYTNLTSKEILTCARCYQQKHNSFIVVIDGKPVCLDCLTDDEYTTYRGGEE
jgi:hypothetical protein